MGLTPRPLEDTVLTMLREGTSRPLLRAGVLLLPAVGSGEITVEPQAPRGLEPRELWKENPCR